MNFFIASLTEMVTARCFSSSRFVKKEMTFCSMFLIPAWSSNTANSVIVYRAFFVTIYIHQQCGNVAVTDTCTVLKLNLRYEKTKTYCKRIRREFMFISLHVLQ